MSNIIVSSNKALPRSVDVMVNVTKDQAEVTTDLSTTVFATPNMSFTHGAERIQFYTELSQMDGVFLSSEEAYIAGTTFFAQNPRARTFAVGGIFTTPQSGYMRGKAYNTDVPTWQAVSDGSFTINVDSLEYDITGLDFSGITVIGDIVAIIQAGLTTSVAGATVTEDNGTLRFTSDSTGATSTVSALTAVDPATGTDISGLGFINATDDPQDPADNVIIADGYTPTGNIADELSLIEEAALASGKNVYAYTLDKEYRDSSDQIDAAGWAEARTKILGLCLNSPLVLDPNSTSDVGYLLNQAGNVRTFSTYHENAYYYPEVGILARLLSVNYALENSTITAKFKDIVGVPTVGIDETDLNVLLSKRVNTFTLVGNNARTYREGQQASPTWFIDDLINLDNFQEELQVAVYNVFLKNGKLPYNTIGTGLIYDAIAAICERYVFNATFSEREILDPTGELNEILIDAAYTITQTPFALMTQSERANRVSPPFTIDVNLAGAIHSVAIQVNAFS